MPYTMSILQFKSVSTIAVSDLKSKLLPQCLTEFTTTFGIKCGQHLQISQETRQSKVRYAFTSTLAYVYCIFLSLMTIASINCYYCITFACADSLQLLSFFFLPFFFSWQSVAPKLSKILMAASRRTNSWSIQV